MNSKVDNPLKWLALVPIKLYQFTLGRLMPNTCRFYPSCSAYAYSAIDRYGVFRGGWMAVKRLSRCHPFNPGGFDPVPTPEKRE